MRVHLFKNVKSNVVNILPVPDFQVEGVRHTGGGEEYRTYTFQDLRLRQISAQLFMPKLKTFCDIRFAFAAQ